MKRPKTIGTATAHVRNGRNRTIKVTDVPTIDRPPHGHCFWGPDLIEVERLARTLADNTATISFADLKARAQSLPPLEIHCHAIGPHKRTSASKA